MGLYAKAGVFNAVSAGAGSTQDVTFGFQPKAVLFLASVGYTNANQGFEANHWTLIGMADGTNRWSATFLSLDNASPSSVLAAGSSTAAIKIAENGVTDTAITFLANGFRVTWSGAIAGANTYPIMYLALGGSDIAGAAVVSTSVSGTGAKSLTGISFQPDTALFAYAGSQGNDRVLSFGAVDAAKTQWAAAISATTGVAQASFNAKRYQRTDSCVLGMMGAIEEVRAALTSFDAHGLTLNVATNGNTGSFTYGALLLKCSGAYGAQSCAQFSPDAGGIKGSVISWFPIPTAISANLNPIAFFTAGIGDDMQSAILANARMSIGLATIAFEGGLWGGTTDATVATRSDSYHGTGYNNGYISAAEPSSILLGAEVWASADGRGFGTQWNIDNYGDLTTEVVLGLMLFSTGNGSWSTDFTASLPTMTGDIMAPATGTLVAEKILRPPTPQSLTATTATPIGAIVRGRRIASATTAPGGTLAKLSARVFAAAITNPSAALAKRIATGAAASLASWSAARAATKSATIGHSAEIAAWIGLIKRGRGIAAATTGPSGAIARTVAISAAATMQTWSVLHSAVKGAALDLAAATGGFAGSIAKRIDRALAGSTAAASAVIARTLPVVMTGALAAWSAVQSALKAATPIAFSATFSGFSGSGFSRTLGLVFDAISKAWGICFRGVPQLTPRSLNAPSNPTSILADAPLAAWNSVNSLWLYERLGRLYSFITMTTTELDVFRSNDQGVTWHSVATLTLGYKYSQFPDVLSDKIYVVAQSVPTIDELGLYLFDPATDTFALVSSGGAEGSQITVPVGISMPDGSVIVTSELPGEDGSVTYFRYSSAGWSGPHILDTMPDQIFSDAHFVTAIAAECNTAYITVVRQSPYTQATQGVYLCVVSSEDEVTEYQIPYPTLSPPFYDPASVGWGGGDAMPRNGVQAVVFNGELLIRSDYGILRAALSDLNTWSRDPVPADCLVLSGDNLRVYFEGFSSTELYYLDYSDGAWTAATELADWSATTPVPPGDLNVMTPRRLQVIPTAAGGIAATFILGTADPDHQDPFTFTASPGGGGPPVVGGVANSAY